MLIIVSAMVTIWNSYRRMESFLFVLLFFSCACFCNSLSVQSWYPSKIRSNLVGSDHHFARQKTSILSLKRTPEEYSSVLQSKKTSRRDVLATASSILATAVAFPNIAQAAEPVNAKDTDSVFAMAKRKLRAKTPRLLRRKMSQDLAALWIRAPYTA